MMVHADDARQASPASSWLLWWSSSRGRGYWKVTAMMFVCTFVAFWERMAFSIAYTEIATEMGLTETEKGMVFAAYYYGFGTTQIPGGYLSKRVGGKAVLAASFFLWVPASAFTALPSRNPDHVVSGVTACRLAVGGAQGMFLPAVQSVLSHWIPPAHRGRHFAFAMSGMFAGAATAMVTVPVIVSDFNVYITFYVAASLAGAWVAVWVCAGSDAPPAEIAAEEADRIQEKKTGEVSAQGTEGAEEKSSECCLEAGLSIDVSPISFEVHHDSSASNSGAEETPNSCVMETALSVDVSPISLQFHKISSASISGAEERPNECVMEIGLSVDVSPISLEFHNNSSAAISSRDLDAAPTRHLHPTTRPPWHSGTIGSFSDICVSPCTTGKLCTDRMSGIGHFCESGYQTFDQQSCAGDRLAPSSSSIDLARAEPPARDQRASGDDSSVGCTSRHKPLLSSCATTVNPLLLSPIEVALTTHAMAPLSPDTLVEDEKSEHPSGSISTCGTFASGTTPGCTPQSNDAGPRQTTTSCNGGGGSGRCFSRERRSGNSFSSVGGKSTGAVCGVDLMGCSCGGDSTLGSVAQKTVSSRPPVPCGSVSSPNRAGGVLAAPRVLGISTNDSKSKPSRFPWRKMLASPAAWACVAGNVGAGTAINVMMSWLPTYFEDFIQVDLENIGTVAQVSPYLTMMVFSILGGLSYGWLTVSRGVSVANSSKIITGVAFFLAMAVFMCMGLARSLATGTLLSSLALATAALSRGGWSTNHVEIAAPEHAAILYSVANCVSAATSVVGISVTGKLLDAFGGVETPVAWTAAMGSIGVFCVLCGVFFAIFAQGNDILFPGANQIEGPRARREGLQAEFGNVHGEGQPVSIDWTTMFATPVLRPNVLTRSLSDSGGVFAPTAASRRLASTSIRPVLR